MNDEKPRAVDPPSNRRIPRIPKTNRSTPPTQTPRRLPLQQRLPCLSSTKVLTSLLGLTWGLRPLLAPPIPAYAAVEQQQAASVVAPSTDGAKGKGPYVRRYGGVCVCVCVRTDRLEGAKMRGAHSPTPKRKN